MEENTLLRGKFLIEQNQFPMDVEFSNLGHGNKILLGFKEAPTIDNFDHAYKSSTFTIKE